MWFPIFMVLCLLVSACALDTKGDGLYVPNVTNTGGGFSGVSGSAGSHMIAGSGAMDSAGAGGTMSSAGASGKTGLGMGGASGGNGAKGGSGGSLNNAGGSSDMGGSGGVPTAGASGSGPAGFGGSVVSAGQAGSGDYAGSVDSGGYAGSAGSSGSGGYAGVSGSSGSAGSGGTAGSGDSSGSSGTGGSSGSSSCGTTGTWSYDPPAGFCYTVFIVNGNTCIPYPQSSSDGACEDIKCWNTPGSGQNVFIWTAAPSMMINVPGQIGQVVYQVLTNQPNCADAANLINSPNWKVAQVSGPTNGSFTLSAQGAGNQPLIFWVTSLLQRFLLGKPLTDHLCLKALLELIEQRFRFVILKRCFSFI